MSINDLIAQLLGAAVALWLIAHLVSELRQAHRTGEFTPRGGIVDRRKNPVQFAFHRWWNILLIVAALGLLGYSVGRLTGLLA